MFLDDTGVRGKGGKARYKSSLLSVSLGSSGLSCSGTAGDEAKGQSTNHPPVSLKQRSPEMMDELSRQILR